MTVNELIRLCRRHGHTLFYKDGPCVKPDRPGLVLPREVQQKLVDNRDIIVAWFEKNVRREWEPCAVCKADAHESMTKADAQILCGRVETKKTPHCPYKEPLP